MALRIGFDLDGTVADMYSSLHQEAIELFGEEMLANWLSPEGADAITLPPGTTDTPLSSADDATSNLAMEELHLTAKQQMQLWDHVKKIENFWTTLPEMEPGIIARIAKAAADRRWEIIFLTTRPSTAGELTQLQSQWWLDAHGFRYPSVMVVQHSRGKIADALHLDAFVDDRPENCLDIAVESKAKVILMWHGHLKDVPAGAKRLGIRPVTTISEALSLLEQLDDIRKQPGILRPIKRAFGRDTDVGWLTGELLHPVHVRYRRAARALGHLLIVGRDVVEARGERVVRIDLASGYPTTAIIDRVRRALTRDQD